MKRAIRCETTHMYRSFFVSKSRLGQIHLIRRMTKDAVRRRIAAYVRTLQNKPITASCVFGKNNYGILQFGGRRPFHVSYGTWGRSRNLGSDQPYGRLWRRQSRSQITRDEAAGRRRWGSTHWYNSCTASFRAFWLMDGKDGQAPEKGAVSPRKKGRRLRQCSTYLNR